MEIPVIDFGELDGENRSKTMALLDHACDKWGFFMVCIISLCKSQCFLSCLLCILNVSVNMQVDNHGIDKGLMEKVKKMINSHYEEHLKEKFYQSEMVKALSEGKSSDADWESSFFISHKPTSNICEIPNISEELR